jgi:hypothetical protein
MRLDRNLKAKSAAWMYVLVIAAWLSALDLGLVPAAVAGALVSTGLCITLLLIARPSLRVPREIALPQRPKGESAEFQREMHQLCAALKLSISFCERHRKAEPDVLLQELEEMGDNIRVFVDRIARPVRFVPRVGSAADLCRPRSPQP